MSLSCIVLEVIILVPFFDGILIYCIYGCIIYLYICSENTKNVLLAACFIHLKHKEHEKYTADLTTINPRILLSGPAGVWTLFYCSLFFPLSNCLPLFPNFVVLQGQKYIRRCWQKHLQTTLELSCSYLIAICFWV